jgi:hypothetical protein
MRNLQTFWTLGMLLVLALSGARAQDSSSPPPSAGDAPQNASQQPVPAYGQENAPPSVTENPPLSGLDLPSLQPHAAPLSYLQPGATFSQSIGSNAIGILGGGGVSSITRALGSITMNRLWSNYDLAMNYFGGVAYYSAKGQGFQLLQQLDLDQKIFWKRGQLSVRDSFSYLPEGNFGGAYGSMGSQGASSLGNSIFGGFWGGNSLGNLGLAPRILNVSLADISESLSAKSTVTLAGGYAFSHFYGTDTTGSSFIGSSQVSVQAGYNRVLTPHTQIALVYGYQAFDFSVEGSAFHTHIIQGVYGHRVTGRLDFLIGAGPQIAFIDTQTATCSLTIVSPFYCSVFGGTLIPATDKSTKLGVSAQARLRYMFPKTSMYLDFKRFDTSGSGFLAGAQSNIVNLGAERPLSRVWDAFVNIGYSTNDRLQPLSQFQLIQCGNPQTSQTACPANNAGSYNYGFAGAGVHRAFGRELHAYFSYQFNRLSFSNSFCGAVACNRISNQSLATVGLDWTPRPIRID